MKNTHAEEQTQTNRPRGVHVPQFTKRDFSKVNDRVDIEGGSQLIPLQKIA